MKTKNENKTPEVNIITTWQKKGEDFYAPGALIEVKNGKGILKEVYGETETDTYSTLLFGDRPLFQLQGDEYYCPTCEKMLRSGYGLEQTEEFRMDKINQSKEYVTFEEALEEIKPLLGLLPSNHYIVLDTTLYPTDGNGHLFWQVPDEDKYVPGTCIYYYRDAGLMWGKLRPYFTVATQPVTKLCKERVEFYRQNSGGRALAYYMDGYMTALLDGHHKTMAAALEHSMVNALVIMPCYIRHHRQEDNTLKEYIGMGDISFSCDEYKITAVHAENKVDTHQMKKIVSAIKGIMQDMSLPYNTDELVKFYPDTEEVAYIDLAGEITDEYLDKIAAGEVVLDETEALILMRALSGLKHKRIWEIADAMLCWKHPEIYPAMEALMKLERTEELEQYLLEKMIEFEDDYPWVKDMILEYL